MNNRKYSQKAINKARKLYDTTSMSLVKIAKKCGFKSTTPIRWHCDRRYRKKHTKLIRRWRKENPERLKEINLKAAKKYYNKNK